MKLVALILYFLFTNSLTFAQNQVNFSSAEERIVYNKNHSLDKYTGVLVEYSYKIISKEPYENNELTELASASFTGVIGTEIYENDGIRYLSILTEGSRENHKASFDLRDREFKLFEFYKRNYHLK